MQLTIDFSLILLKLLLIFNFHGVAQTSDMKNFNIIEN